MNLTEEQLDFCQRYAALIETINEALDYVAASFTDFEKTEGDVVLQDVIDAFAQIAQSHVTLEILFQEEEKMVETIEAFVLVVNEASMLDGNLADPTLMCSIITEGLTPTYHKWSEKMQKELQPYIVI
ncbi:hypothetical protein [Falsibacillus albus]|uniref:DUF8042 domain-containing protein n=1 Tax=Falsibacillus albus TaxID=2478915 RepID=A0A3L7K442_9BACI|nr:hypothetical protein [Falsibacillus albus]RLQ96781.1 hypothetical protein D9X91_06690 [Falsibacillus albus]